MARVNVLVVDDSAVIRRVISEVLGRDPSIHVMAAVADPLFAIQRMRSHWPDVIVLDIEMPRMDGMTFLQKIMAERPTPVVVCSTLTTRGAATTLQALAAGAVTVVEKPRVGAKAYLMDVSAELTHAVKAASRANVRNLCHPLRTDLRDDPDASAAEPASGPLKDATGAVVAIGTSTGGTQALEMVLAALPRSTPGVVVVQHMPEKFTAMFAARLDALCRMEVREARNQDRVLPGRVLIAPGGRHMSLQRGEAGFHVEVKGGPLVHHHRPSVDVLFRSVAGCAGSHALGILMTGMGSDGALGLKEMHDAGARTLAQDEATSVVFGMPREAIRLGAVDRVVALQDIAQEIGRLSNH